MIAMACFQEAISYKVNPESDDRDRGSEAYQSALTHYSNAINQLRQSQPDLLPLEVILTACTLFATFENLQNHHQVVCTHVRAAAVLFHQYELNNPKNTSLAVENILRPVFDVFVIDSYAFRDGFFGLSGFIDEEYMLEAQLRVPCIFFTSYQAYECMDGILKCIFRSTSGTPMSRKLMALERVKELLPMFLETLKSSADFAARKKDQQLYDATQALHMHQLVAMIMAETRLTEDQMAYDAYESTFHDIVTHAEKLNCRPSNDDRFNVHLGFLPPLFFVATRCRSPNIRRKAILLLHQSARRERTWDSCTAAQIAHRTMQIEEGVDFFEHRGDIAQRTLPASTNRVMLKNAYFDNSTRRTVLQFRSYPWDTDISALTDSKIEWGPGYTSEDMRSETAQEKVFRAAGYAGNLLTCHKVRCQCPRGQKVI